jgi:hypothetical protein
MTTFSSIRRTSSNSPEPVLSSPLPGSEPPEPTNTLPRPDRSEAGGPRRQPRPLQPLEAEDCGGREQWDAVRACLAGIEGLKVSDDSIVADSRLGEEGLESVAKAIGILVNADHLMAACTLMRMCKASVRLALMERCSPDFVDKLTSSKNPEVSKAVDRALILAARYALRHDLPEFFKLLPLCSPEARTHLYECFPLLTKDMADDLSDRALIEAVRITLTWIPNLDTRTCLAELHSLLTIAGHLEGRNRTWAVWMKCIIQPVLHQIRESVASGDERMKFLDELDELQSMARLSPLAYQMARDLVMAGELKDADLVATIFSSRIDEAPEHERALILSMLEGLGIQGNISLASLMASALPTLCSAHPFELEVILRMGEGRRLVAQAVQILLLHGPDAATVALLFDALAHRVDLRAVPTPLSQSAMMGLSRHMATLDLDALLGNCTRRLHQWAPGWRHLLLMSLDPALAGDSFLSRAIQAIDAAAADSLLGGAEERLDILSSPAVLRALLSMQGIRVPATGQSLLSADALHNVMRAVVGDRGLVLDVCEQLTAHPAQPVKVTLCTAMARALISLLDDASPCRFNPELPAAHAAGDVAEFLVHRSGAGNRLKSEMGETAWTRILSLAT